MKQYAIIIAVAIVLGTGAWYEYRSMNHVAPMLPTQQAGAKEGCSLLSYTGTTSLSEVPYTSPGEADFRGGMICSFTINSKLPSFTFHFIGQEDNTLGNIEITQGNNPNIIQTIDDVSNLVPIDPNSIAPESYRSILVPVDANFDGYKDVPILIECGATGNCSYDFYLYDPTTNKFVHNAFLSNLGTFQLDSAKKQLTASSNSSASDWEDDTYQYNAGQYSLIKKVISVGNRDSNVQTQTTYELQNGGMKLTDSTTTNALGASATTSVSFTLPFKGFDLHLYAPDEKLSKVSGDFCGGNAGSAMYDGTYQIIAGKNGKVVSTVSIGQREFIAGTPHDGLHVVTYKPTGDQFIVINEYGSCAGDYSSFYALNAAGQLVSIPFVGNGTSTSWVPGGFSDAGAQTDGVFCGYVNTIGYYLCDAYKYNNYSFVQTDSWMAQGDEAITDASRAKRYLFDLGDSDKIRPYVPSDAQYVDEIDEVQTAALPYKFQVDFAGSGINDYKYIFEVNKTKGGFQAVLPPTKI